MNVASEIRFIPSILETEMVFYIVVPSMCVTAGLRENNRERAHPLVLINAAILFGQTIADCLSFNRKWHRTRNIKENESKKTRKTMTTHLD